MKDISEQIKKNLIHLFSVKKDFVIIGHHNPDGDAIGSALGLFHTLYNSKKNVSVIMPTSASDFLKWLPGYSEIVIYDDNKEKSDILLAKADVIICVDFNDFSRVEKAEDTLKNSAAIKILIDHHPNPSNLFDYSFSNEEASSASEIVYEFIDLLNYKDSINIDAAISIFTGIMTDTINFSVNSSRTETFKILSYLLAFGIDKDKIYNKVYNNFSVDRLRLVGYLMHKKLIVIDEFHLAIMVLTKEEMNKFNYREGDHEGVVNMPLSVSEISSSIIAIEKDSHIKLSSRSKDTLDLNKLSRMFFNGGGHKNAAGGTLYIPIVEVEDFIIKSVKDFLQKGV